MDPAKSVAAIQGFGNVSQYAALGFTELLGGKVVCVSYWDRADRVSYTVSKADGINPRFLMSITDIYGAINKDQAVKEGYTIEPGENWISKDVDVLIPGALEGQVNADTVKKVSSRVRLVAEGANGPTTPEADPVLQQRGIYVIPDFLCNAGGVTCSYFEQVQANMNFFWEKDEVLKRLDGVMTRAFHAMADTAERRAVFTRDAAYMIAVERVAQAAKLRGRV
jgi:glutamate dehydrogenase (NAD(P)+)